MGDIFCPPPTGRQRTSRPRRADARTTIWWLAAAGIFLLSVVTLQPLAIYSTAYQAAAPDTAAINADGVTGIMVSLIVRLIPTSIGASLPAIAMPEWTGSCSATVSP